MFFGDSPMINWSFLDYFMAAAKEQNFSKAAQSLYYSQSYLSKKIAALEEELGVTLFERHGKKVILTAAGEHLYQKALKINQRIHELQQDMRQFRQDPSQIDHPTYVYADPYANSLATEILQQCRIFHPEFHYELVPESVGGANDHTDIWCYFTKSDEDCSEETLFFDQEKIYLNKNSPISHKKRLTLKDLSGQTGLIIRTVPRQQEWADQIAVSCPDISFRHVDDVFEAMSLLCSQSDVFEIWNAFSHDSMPLYNTVGIPMDGLANLEFHIELRNSQDMASKAFLQIAKDFCRSIS